MTDENAEIPDLARLLGTPQVFSFEGKDYTVERMDLAGMAEYQLWLERDAVAKAIACTAGLPDAEREAWLSGVRRDIAAKKYAAGGAVFLMSLIEQAGMAKSMSIMLKRRHPEADEEFCVKLISTELGREVAAIIHEWNRGDPGGKVRAALTRLGLWPPSSPRPPSDSPPNPSATGPGKSGG